MVSLIAAPTQLRLSSPIFLSANSSTVFFVCPATRQAPVGTRQTLKPESHSLGRFLQSVGGVRRCSISENQVYSALEQAVLEFMLQSEEPDQFPSRKQLIEAGRRDLADAILRSGGWMTRGWDSVSDDELENAESSDVDMKVQGVRKSELEINGVRNSEASSAELKIPEFCVAQSKDLQGSSAERGSMDDSSGACDSSLPTASSSGRSIEIAEDTGSGIEGILTGLENQRNWSLGLKVTRKGKTSFSNENGLHTTVSDTTDSCYPCKNEAILSLENSTVSIQDNIVSNPQRENKQNTMPKPNGVKSSLEPYTWRTWSIQRAGLSAAEMNFDDSGKGIVPDSGTSQRNALKKGIKESPDDDLKSGGKSSGDKIKSRLQNLELELSSALGLLKSNSENLSQKVDCERSLEDFRNLSDDWEFQENEFMKAHDNLRSLRARFAVLEGKVALAKIDTQKVIDEKQKRVNNARKALKLLRSTCVIWPNTASEVFLTGSFDGWATQRKMEKLSNGTFCVWLRLYPGQYEMKFIVDNTWKVDPLRPIVNSNGNENNLLIIS